MTHTLRKSLAALGLALLLVSPLTATPAAATYSPGAPGMGDPYFPDQGNGGYQVEHYDIAIRYDPSETRMQGVATLTLRLTSTVTDLFYVDLKGLDIESVTLSGQSKTWTRGGPDGINVAIPVSGTLYPGTQLVLQIRYGGVPVTVQNPARAREGGWLRTMEGAVVVAEPNGASTWFPSNDHPRDKATFAFHLTTPPSVGSVANGLPGRTKVGADGWKTTTWTVREPMVTYAATVAIGNFEVTRRKSSVRSLPVIDAISTYALGDIEPDELNQIDRVIPFLEGYLGRYPFETLGAIVTVENSLTALETQTRPVYSRRYFFGVNNPQAGELIAHEQAHQWLGDRVSIHGWKDVWLNEGPATYMHWLWNDHTGWQTVDQSANLAACLTGESWLPPGRPHMHTPNSSDPIYSPTSDRVYTRGAMTIHALRTTIGHTKFKVLMKKWASPSNAGNRTTEEFIAMAEAVARRPLTDFFNTWLYENERPSGVTCKPVTSPQAPRSVTARAKGQTVTLSWKAPKNNGGARIVEYRVFMDNVQMGTAQGLTTAFTIQNVDRSVAHTFEVAAANSAGQGSKESVRVRKK